MDHPIKQFAALGDATRWTIFKAIADHPMAVAEIAKRFPISRPAVSQHLKVLHDANLVRFEQVGTRNIYSVDPAGISRLKSQLDKLWGTGLANLKVLAESTYKKGEKP